MKKLFIIVVALMMAFPVTAKIWYTSNDYLGKDMEYIFNEEFGVEFDARYFEESGSLNDTDIDALVELKEYVSEKSESWLFGKTNIISVYPNDGGYCVIFYDVETKYYCYFYYNEDEE